MPALLDRNGHVAVITGAASGIGAGLAREAARRGMHVVLADRDSGKLAQVAEGIGGQALAVPTDVTDAAAMDALADKAFATHGRVDLLFNNAGVLSTGMSWEISAAQWQRALDINVGGIVNGLRAFVPRLLAADWPAVIINTASVGGFLPSPLMAPYSATKFAVVALTESLAGELAMLNAPLRAALLAPGPVTTDIFNAPPTAASGPFVRVMRDMLSRHGLTPDAFAALVFEALDRGDYWIIPQPEALEPAMSARHRSIVAREMPQFYKTEEQSL